MAKTGGGAPEKVKWGRKKGVEKPMAVLFRSTTPEIGELGALKSREEFAACLAEKRDLRWEVIKFRFLD